MRALYAIEWTEYERGWGQRPDGTSFYVTEDLADAAVERAFAGRGNIVPDEYSNPGPVHLVEVSESLYNKAVENGGSVWTNFSSSKRAKTYDA